MSKSKTFTRHAMEEEHKVMHTGGGPPSEMEPWILANKRRFQREYGAKHGLEVLYARAWLMYRDKHKKKLK